MVEIRDVAALKRRIGRGKDVSFLVGAPFSWDQGKGVPTVAGFLDIIRKRVAEEGPEYTKALEEELGRGDPAETYRRAMSYVYGELDADAVSDIVRSAVLEARAVGAPDLPIDSKTDGLPEHWRLTRAQRGLARLMKIAPDHFQGPVFTTNFDPMIGLALLEQNITPLVLGIAQEGSINAAVQVTPGMVNVFHLHGYWRESATLHRPQQLLANRPQLQGSLERHLNRTNLVVMAYSGWDDIFTEAIARCLATDGFKGVVTWCFYDDIPAVVRERNAPLFSKFAGGIASGRIEFFCDVDCHTIFDEILEHVAPTSISRDVREASPLPGWQLVSNAFLDSLSPLTEAEAVHFFDGAVPTWRHALSPRIPRLNHAATIGQRIAQGLANPAASGMQLIRAAGGEGKSTAMLQAAVDSIRGGNVTAIYRVSQNAGLDPDYVEGLDPHRRWLVVMDDAEQLIDDLWACAERLHRAGRSNVFFLIAARDADWRKERGDQKSWSSRISRLPDLALGGIDAADAERVVGAWEQLGSEGLRALIEVGTTEERARRLVDAVRAQDVKHGEGSFLGGLLATRFSPAGLTDHVVSLMEPLRSQKIEGGEGTLYDALVYIANCHAVGMPGLDRRILAAICDLAPHQVSSAIVAPLGRELGAAESRGHVLTRHKSVAEAVVVASETRFDTDLEDVWTQLVRSTVAFSRVDKVGEMFGPMVHAGSRLKRTLPDRLGAKRCGEIGIAAAEAAMAALPEWSSTIIDLARALRSAGYPEEAANLMQEKSRQLKNTVDKAQNIRGYFYEWGTCAGNVGGRRGALTSVWLAACSLSDALPVEVTLQRADLSCAGLAVAFEHLYDGNALSIYAKGRRAVTQLGWQASPNERGLAYLRRQQKAIDALGTPKPADNAEALAWLTDAAFAAWQELDDAYLRSLKRDGRLMFDRLKKTLSAA